MQTHRSRFVVSAAVLVLFALVATAFAADANKLLTGKWTMTIPARDADGNPCPFVPETMEFFGDGTMIMSNMPDHRLPFKTDPTADEKQAVEARIPALKGKDLLLVKPVPQMEWRLTPIVYSYSITKGELTISVTGWTPATFTRTK